MYLVLFIHSSLNGHLGSFLLWAAVNYAAVNTGAQISPEDPAFNHLWVYTQNIQLFHFH